MNLRRPRPYLTDAEPTTAADPLALEARLLRASVVAQEALVAQARRPAELRDRELIDLCLDVRNILTPVRA